MRVSGISKRCLQQMVRFEPENAAVHDLPEEIEMEYNYDCLHFTGKVGDTVQIALSEKPSLSTRRYSIACDFRMQ